MFMLVYLQFVMGVMYFNKMAERGEHDEMFKMLGGRDWRDKH